MSDAPKVNLDRSIVRGPALKEEKKGDGWIHTMASWVHPGRGCGRGKEEGRGPYLSLRIIIPEKIIDRTAEVDKRKKTYSTKEKDSK